MLWILLFALLRAVIAELVTEGPYIMNNTQRVRLRCLGWNGDPSVDVGALATRVGANCVRLSSTAAINWTQSVWELRQRGLMVFLAYQGLSQTHEWVDVLENLTRAHKFDGVDVGTPAPRSTWGRSTDVYGDWLAAATLICYRLHRIDPELLVAVGAFCNVDLRDMVSMVGPADAFERGKLLFSVKVFPDSIWWHDGLLNVVNILSGLATMYCALMACVYCVDRKSSYSALGNGSVWRMGVAASLVFHFGAFALVLCFMQLMLVANCDALAAQASWALLVIVLALAFSATTLSHCQCRSSIFMAMVYAWASTLFFAVFALTCYLLSPESYVDYMGLMALDDRPVPVWVGATGTQDSTDEAWAILWDRMDSVYALDFSYWAADARCGAMPTGLTKNGALLQPSFAAQLFW